jgi:uncharacterized protein (DUF2147 family)
MRRIAILAAFLTLTTGLASAADPIVGNWRTEDGTRSAIGYCDAGYCITVKSGEYAGRTIGNFSGKDGSYAGQITDPETDRTYNGTLKVSGSTIKMQGCVMNVFCRSQTWTRL